MYLFMEFDLIGSSDRITINCNVISTIVNAGIDRAEIRLITGGVHVVKGTYNEIRDQFYELKLLK